MVSMFKGALIYNNHEDENIVNVGGVLFATLAPDDTPERIDDILQEYLEYRVEYADDSITPYDAESLKKFVESKNSLVPMLIRSISPVGKLITIDLREDIDTSNLQRNNSKVIASDEFGLVNMLSFDDGIKDHSTFILVLDYDEYDEVVAKTYIIDWDFESIGRSLIDSSNITEDIDHAKDELRFVLDDREYPLMENTVVYDDINQLFTVLFPSDEDFDYENDIDYRESQIDYEDDTDD